MRIQTRNYFLALCRSQTQRSFQVNAVQWRPSFISFRLILFLRLPASHGFLQAKLFQFVWKEHSHVVTHNKTALFAIMSLSVCRTSKLKCFHVYEKNSFERCPVGILFISFAPTIHCEAQCTSIPSPFIGMSPLAFVHNL